MNLVVPQKQAEEIFIFNVLKHQLDVLRWC